MSNYLNFSHKETQIVSSTAAQFAVWMLQSKPGDRIDKATIFPAWTVLALSMLQVDTLTDEQKTKFKTALGVDTEAKAPTSQHDFNILTPTQISTVSGVQAHLEGGAGYLIDGDNLDDGWWATLLNTTDEEQSFAFSNCVAIARDGNAIAPVSSPHIVPANSVLLLQLVVNGGTNWLQLIPMGGSGLVNPQIDDIELVAISEELQKQWRDTIGAGTQQAIPVASDVTCTLQLTADQYIYKNNAIYGLKRLRQADVTSYSDRSDVAAAGNPYRALNGQGTTDLWSASFQWLSYTLPSTNIWSIELSTNHGNASARRRLQIGGTDYLVSQNSGDQIYKWVSPSTAGYTPVTTFGYREDTNDRTLISDWKVLASNGTAPTGITAQGLLYQLQTGDYFRLTSQGLNVLLRYEGIDTVSKAWKASTVPSLGSFDSQLIIGSKNGVENNAIALRFAEIVGTVPAAGNSLEKIWNKLQTAGQDWFLVETTADRDAIGISGDRKYVRVLKARTDAAGDDVWVVYQGRAVLNDDPAIAPVMAWDELFSSEIGGSSDLANRFSSFRTTVETAIKDLSDRVAALVTQCSDTIAPKLVLLDPIGDIVSPGDHSIEFRVYIDD